MSRQKRSALAITKAVIFALVLREFLTRFGSRRMGAFWLLFEPAVHIVVMMTILGLMRAGSMPGVDISVFLLTGMVPFFLMRNIALNLMEAINANRALFSYPNITIFDTYVARTIVEILVSIAVYLILIFVLGFWFGHDVKIEYPLEWIFALIIGVFFSFGLGVFFSVITQVMPNVKTFIRIMFLPLYLMSGVIFPIWMIPSQYLPFLLWNPYMHIIDKVRSAIFISYPETQGINYSYPLSMAVLFLFFSLGLYRVRREALLTR